ncbi:hypothetical protein ACQRD6_00025 [Prevotella sp. SGI.027]|nr:hypothetical protein [Prevotellaceae bacterium]MDY5843294.1 hypothetical protein [Prevotella sp.]
MGTKSIEIERQKHGDGKNLTHALGDAWVRLEDSLAGSSRTRAVRCSARGAARPAKLCCIKQFAGLP